LRVLARWSDVGQQGEGRLAKGELDARLSQTFASRTYAELAALTADLPAGLAGTRPPRQPARAPARPAMSKVIAGAALLIPPTALLPPAFLTGNDKWAKSASPSCSSTS
jgi:uncharacterized protein DUF1707